MSSLRQFRFQRSVPGSSASSGELGDDGAAGGQKRARTPEEEEPGPGVNGVQQHNSGSAYDAETDDGDSQQLSESPVFRPSQVRNYRRVVNRTVVTHDAPGTKRTERSRWRPNLDELHAVELAHQEKLSRA